MSFAHEVKLIQLAEHLFDRSQHRLDEGRLDEIGVIAFEIVALVQLMRIGNAASPGRGAAPVPGDEPAGDRACLQV
jgi:hypothetical protein